MTRFVLVGGFLGAGKTTLIARLAHHYTSQGQRVGIVTNDQAADLVDTHTLRSQGFDVDEVAGACFCCSFDELVERAGQLGREGQPDVLLAEPVGSCTDLVATVVLPLERLYGERFRIAPYGVLLKPSHGQRILAGGNQRSGFSPQAEYIFRKQLEEADYLMIGRADQLPPEEVERLAEQLREAAPAVPIMAVSPRTGAGMEGVLEQIDAGAPRAHRTLELDYDRYAEGEAELGWVNVALRLQASAPVDLDALVTRLLEAAARDIAKAGGEIAHLKCSAMGDGLQAVGSLVSSDSAVEQALQAGRPAAGTISVIVNARVAMDPERLLQAVERGSQAAASKVSATILEQQSHALRPGRPVPVHRMA